MGQFETLVLKDELESNKGGRLSMCVITSLCPYQYDFNVKRKQWILPSYGMTLREKGVRSPILKKK